MAQVIAGKFQAIVRDRIGCTAVDGRIPASGWGCRKHQSIRSINVGGLITLFESGIPTACSRD